MNINTKIVNRTINISISGELDLNTVRFVDQAIEDKLSSSPKINSILLVLEEIDFIDSSGIGIMLKYYKRSKALGGNLILCGAKPQVKRVLDIAGVVKLIPMVNTEKEAQEIIGGEKNYESH